MKFKRKFQEGGAMPAGSAPQGGEQDPMVMLAQGALQAVQTSDCETALLVCQMLLEMMGAGAPQGAPLEAAPAPAESEPVFKFGGTLPDKRRLLSRKRK